MSDFDTLGRAGARLGALVAEPMRGLLASGGAVITAASAWGHAPNKTAAAAIPAKPVFRTDTVHLFIPLGTS